MIPLLIFAVASAINNTSNGINQQPTPFEDIIIEEENGIELELFLNSPLNVPEATIEIELVSIASSDPDCFDCLSATLVEVRNTGEVEVWDYSCGGFSGECNYQFKAFGYVYEALDLRTDSMLVKVYSDQ